MQRQSDWPTLKGKAHNSAVVSEFLSEIAQEHQFDHASRIRAQCLQAFVDIWHQIQDTKYPDFKLSAVQCEELEDFRSTALLSYLWLSKHSDNTGTYVYKMRPKSHHFDEGLRRSIRTSISLSVYYSFTPEDMMGLVARMSRRCHPSSIPRRGVSRWLLSFFSR